MGRNSEDGSGRLCRGIRQSQEQSQDSKLGTRTREALCGMGRAHCRGDQAEAQPCSHVACILRHHRELTHRQSYVQI